MLFIGDIDLAIRPDKKGGGYKEDLEVRNRLGERLAHLDNPNVHALFYEDVLQYVKI